jgi:hypothetical protein
MAVGALAFAFFSFSVCQLIMRLNLSAFAASTAGLLVWFAAALGLEQVLIR